MELIFGQGQLKIWVEENKSDSLVAVAGPKGKAAAEAGGFQKIIFCRDLSAAELDRVAGLAAGAKTIAAVGDGKTAMAARRVALKTGAELVVVPTELTGSSLVNEAAGVVEAGVFKEEGRVQTRTMVVDPTLIWGGTEDDSRAGVGDLLGVITAVESISRMGQGFEEDKATSALELVHETMDWADDIFDLTESGMKRLAGLFDAREQFIRSLGRNYIEGPETALWMLFQHKRDFRLPFGRLKILCVILAGGIMELNMKPVKQYLHWIKAPHLPEDMGLTDDDIASIIPEFPAFAAKHPVSPSILDTMDLSGPTSSRAISALRDRLIKSSFETRDD